MANSKETTRANLLHHLQMPVGSGLIVSNRIPDHAEYQRKDGIRQEQPKPEFVGRRPFMNRFTSKNDHNTGKTRQRDGDLRRNAKSFARFHCKISLTE